MLFGAKGFEGAPRSDCGRVGTAGMCTIWLPKMTSSELPLGPTRTMSGKVTWSF